MPLTKLSSALIAATISGCQLSESPSQLLEPPTCEELIARARNAENTLEHFANTPPPGPHGSTAILQATLRARNAAIEASHCDE